MSKLTTITQKNQITIPVDIISNLDLKAGDKLMVKKDGDFIKLVPIDNKSFLDLEGIVKSTKTPNFKKLRKQFEQEMAEKAVK